MLFEQHTHDDHSLAVLTDGWGTHDEVTLYLDRCQVDSSANLVKLVWDQTSLIKKSFGKVVDFGAGDGRFATLGDFKQYIGFEIDKSRCLSAQLPKNAKLTRACAFSTHIDDADLCIGNPPYVRNQDLPAGWRQSAAELLKERAGFALSGLANAWQYFFLLALLSTSGDGIVSLVIPYEWVSRPSSKRLREYIRAQGWDVQVYRLADSTFPRVLTTSSITIVNKRSRNSVWSFYSQEESGGFVQLPSVTTRKSGILEYRRRKTSEVKLSAKRGLSPGTQRVFTLTESERARLGLRIDTDVVPCITSLRHLPDDVSSLSEAAFRKHYREAGKRCWLIRADGKQSERLRGYLDSVDASLRDTATCLNREVWWQFTMPNVPGILISSGFRGTRTKAVTNPLGARAVGSVCGAYGGKKSELGRIATLLRNKRLGDRVVAHSNGLKKLEINQLNTVLDEIVQSLAAN
jgi:hypothetical protein